MTKHDLDEQSLEKLAWIIAEEFVENCEQPTRQENSEIALHQNRDPKLRMIFAWGNPAVALPRR